MRGQGEVKAQYTSSFQDEEISIIILLLQIILQHFCKIETIHLNLHYHTIIIWQERENIPLASIVLKASAKMVMCMWIKTLLSIR